MFNYLRVFSVLSLLTVVIIALMTGMHVRYLAVDEIVSATEKQDVNIAQNYVNTIWKKYREAIIALPTQSEEEQKDTTQINAFAQETVAYFQRMNLIRVNLYNGSGQLLMTINSLGNKIQFLNNAASIDNVFVSKQMKRAVAGSKIARDVELEGGGTLIGMQAVIPIRSQDGTPRNEGALEILHDISVPWGKFVNLQIYGTIGVILMFLVFMAVWFVSSNRAEAIISKQYEINLELAAAAAAAQAENRDKSQFLANVSHELRTPLNAIIGFSEIIKSEVIAMLQERKYHDYINDIHSSGVHLLSLINDILEYSKAEAGKLELEVSEINATKMIQNSMRLLAPRAESAQVILTEALPKEQIILVIDGKKFKQILLNLLSNAVKFTPPNGEVRVSAWRNISDDTYSFEVKDSGIGIAAKDISRAMSPFGQVDNKLSRKYEGTGLGLPLTKKFVELMGGKFSIQSEVNVGTTVTFTLPRQLTEREGIIIKQLA